MRVVIMGSGGVGGYVGARLQAAGEDVAFIPRGAHLQALQTEGLRLEHPQHPLHLLQVQASADPAELARGGPADLAVFAVKLGDAAAAARALGPLLGPQTRILTLQNGIDSVDLIRPNVGATLVCGGVIYVSAVIDRPGVIRSPGGLHAIVADAGSGDPVMAAFFAAFCNRLAGQAGRRHSRGAVGEVHRADRAVGHHLVAARADGRDPGPPRDPSAAASARRGSGGRGRGRWRAAARWLGRRCDGEARRHAR